MSTYSIIKKSQLEGAKRLDAEYYQPEYLEANHLVQSFGAVKLGDLLTLREVDIEARKIRTNTRRSV